MLEELFDTSEGVLRFAIYICILVGGCALALLSAYIAILLAYRIGQAVTDFLNLLFDVPQESLLWLQLLNI